MKALLADTRTNPNLRDKQQHTALDIAIIFDHLAIFKLLFADSRIDIAEMAVSLWFIAISERRVEIIKFLITQKFDFNTAFTDGTTPLIMAINRGHLEILETLLLDPDIDVNLAGMYQHRDISGGFRTLPATPLIFAVLKKDSAMVTVLLKDKRTKINQSIHTGYTALHNVVNDYHKVNTGSSRYDIAKLLLADSNINVNQTSMDGLTPLRFAVENEDHDMVALFLSDMRFEINKTMDDGSTAFMLAIQKENLEIVQIMLANQHLDVNLPRNDGVTPFCMAVNERLPDIIKLLLADERLKINLEIEPVIKLLFIASQRGHFAVVECLLEVEGIDLSMPFIEQKDQLNAFAKDNQVEEAMNIFINAKLEAGCNAGEIPVTPKEIASIMGHCEIVRLIDEHENKSGLKFGCG